MFFSDGMLFINEEILKIISMPDITVEQFSAISELFTRYRRIFEIFKKVNISLFKKLENLIQQTNFSIRQQLLIADMLYICSSPDSLEQQRAITNLVELAERTDLSIEQSISAAQTLYRRLPAKSIERQQATTKLVELVERTDLSIEQSISSAQTLYRSCPNKSPEEQIATQKLVTLLELPGLPKEQRILADQALYRCSRFGSSERLRATQELQQQVLNQDRLLDQRMQSAFVPITERDTNYADRAQAINIIFTLADIETATSQIKKQWISVVKDNIVPAIDIPHLIDLVNDERIPIEIRDEMCGELERLIPEFGNIALEDR
jgi:hypothetical protein